MDPKPSDQAIPIICNFMDIFSTELPGLPLEQEIEFSIDLIPRILYLKTVYRMNRMELLELEHHITTLREKKFIIPSHSPWDAPVLFVKKKDKTLRLCINYRELN